MWRIWRRWVFRRKLRSSETALSDPEIAWEGKLQSNKRDWAWSKIGTKRNCAANLEGKDHGCQWSHIWIWRRCDGKAFLPRSSLLNRSPQLLFALARTCSQRGVNRTHNSTSPGITKRSRCVLVVRKSPEQGPHFEDRGGIVHAHVDIS